MNEPKLEASEFRVPSSPSVVLALIRQHAGLTLTALHALGYVGVFDALQQLLDEELIFKHNEHYLPND